MSSSPLRAVVFDLFGTLVDNLDPATLADATQQMADALGAPVAGFRSEWRRNFTARMDGSVPDGDEQFLPILEALGLPAAAADLGRASTVRRDFMRGSLVPKPGALECLTAFREQGLALALASDCSSETPSLLDETPLGEFLEVRACSAHLGVRKPDARIYRHVLDELGVPGSRCLYVGDGNSEELPGARAHGMITAWVDNGERQHWHERFVPGGDYHVHHLEQLVAIVENMTTR